MAMLHCDAAHARKGGFGSFSPLAHASPFGAILPCEQGPTEGECQDRKRTPTRLRPLGVGFHVASVHQQSLVPCGRGLVQLPPTREILNASSAILSKECGRVDP